ncbi:MAG: glycogen/starch/alpha-glucan phosphorylase [Clostridiaceae bacterium]|nr:glycogen/starch/alpha-glucan phosphorylase [Clostridiaceae bacterium]
MNNFDLNNKYASAEAMALADEMRLFLTVLSGKEVPAHCGEDASSRTEPTIDDQCAGAISAREYWQGLSAAVMARMMPRWLATKAQMGKRRHQHYMSAEFLVGRALLNNLVNLDMYEEAEAAARSLGIDLKQVLEAEVDPALGNGGLGRLAACFMDSATTLNLNAGGYGILYHYGLFKQKIVNGFQEEHPDEWLDMAYPFLIEHRECAVEVSFADMTVRAVPHDLPITGYRTNNINTLRLWNAESIEPFNIGLFNAQKFNEASAHATHVADICRVLYPNDSTPEGRALRLRQQYFFTSASLQDILRDFRRKHGTNWDLLPDYHCVQLNDTHPVIAIPELMRLLIDEHGCDWDSAWNITRRMFAYTNHTTLSEALERWDMLTLEYLLPRVAVICRNIDAQFRQEMAAANIGHDRLNRMAPILNGYINMAWLACYTAYSINGVAAMHTEIIKRDTLRDFYTLWPEKFSNKTNGVTPRRWLRMCNPGLSAMITRLLGSDAWVTNLDLLQQLLSFVDDPAVQDEFLAIKEKKKADLADWLRKTHNIDIPVHGIYDIQIKRLHEYKRQLLYILYILDLYFRIKEDGLRLSTPQVCIFGAKAASGYYRAKSIIKLINEVSRLISADPLVSEQIKVVFIPNYNVSVAEKLFPAADVSEQISTTGKEASGTGNMKFMMNGALTLGTPDGANVEIAEAVGAENVYTFGPHIDEMPGLMASYNPSAAMKATPGLERTMNALRNGLLNDGGTGRFADLYRNLVEGQNWERPDIYYVLGDFAAYRAAHDRIAADFENRREWARRCLINIAMSGRFSSDRTVQDYADEIWNLEPHAVTLD